MVTSRALIIGLAGSQLTPDERRFLREVRPWGVILFARNLETVEQIQALVSDVQEQLGDAHAPILIDQEGGRVARLRPPLARPHPPAAIYGALYRDDPEQARHACFLGAQRLAEDLIRYGININCAPCLDVLQPDADAIIGDRAFSDDAECVGVLGRAFIEGLQAGGVLPVIKHIPGHGRAQCDSHLALPIISDDLDALQRVDFKPFSMCRDAPLAMTGHLMYTALDADQVSTCSPTIIQKVIRDEIGFSGLLMSDDISMEALSGTLRERGQAAMAAGCDLILHCNGRFSEMQDLATIAPELSDTAQRQTREISDRLSAPKTSTVADELLWGELVSSVWKAD